MKQIVGSAGGSTGPRLASASKSAVEFISKRGEVSAREVTDELAIEGIKLHHQTDLNESLVQALLIHWGIRSGLLAYDGRTGKFKRPS